MTYPAGSVETNGGTFVETPFQLNGKLLRIKTNLQTGAADFYIQTVGGDQLIASTDVNNNWSVKNTANLINALGNVPSNLIDTPQKQNQYFLNNYTLNLNNLRAQVLNTKYPDGTQTTFANTPGYGNNPAAGASGTTPPTSTGTGGGGLFGFLQGGLPSVGDFATTQNPAFARALEYPLKYPKDLLVNRQDTLRISQFSYQSPNQDIFKENLSTILTQGLQRRRALKDYLGQVILPIPNNPQDSNNVAWGEDSMNAFTTAATAAIVQNPGPAAGALAGAAAANTLLGALGLGNLGNIASNAPPAVLRAILASQGGGTNNASTAAAIYSYILSKYQFEVSPESILSRGLGVIPNSNLQLLFNNVTLRSFNFSYMMSPRSEEEAKDVNMILRFFKQGMAAKKKNVQAGAASLYLGTPNVFKLEYKSGNQSIKGMNKFKICALTGFGVNYAPSGQWMAYEEGQPASVVMTMGFRELEPVYETDYQSNIPEELQNDLASVTNEDIGY